MKALSRSLPKGRNADGREAPRSIVVGSVTRKIGRPKMTAKSSDQICLDLGVLSLDPRIILPSPFV
jgi:hypothetical protein